VTVTTKVMKFYYSMINYRLQQSKQEIINSKHQSKLLNRRNLITYRNERVKLFPLINNLEKIKIIFNYNEKLPE